MFRKLFRKTVESTCKPADLVSMVNQSISIVEEGHDIEKINTAIAQLGKNLISIKNFLLFSKDDTDTARNIAQLVQDLCKENLPFRLMKILHLIDFESREAVALLFNNLLHYQDETGYSTFEGVVNNEEFLTTLVTCYEHPELVLPCGQMLRECTRFETLACVILNSKEFFNFFKYIESPLFGLASDAFISFKQLLTAHPNISSKFLENNYKKFMRHFRKLLNSENYATGRLSLELLLNILLQIEYVYVREKYISRSQNLKFIMKKMRSSSEAIQLDAFHIFRLFALNPEKNIAILKVLSENKVKIIEFLHFFRDDHEYDQEMADYKGELAAEIILID